MSTSASRPVARACASAARYAWDASSAIAGRLDAVRAQLDRVVSWSESQMAREESSLAERLTQAATPAKQPADHQGLLSKADRALEERNRLQIANHRRA